MQVERDDSLHDELPPYLANLGLLSEPFADSPSGHFFYVGGDIEQRLDLMHHLAPYSPLLIVVGEPGSGKTALLHQFMARAKDNWRVIVVTARSDMDKDDFLSAISEGVGLSSQSRIDPQAQYPALIAQLRALRQTAQVPILLLDDAQNLSVGLLELIHTLCAENDDGHILSVMLFGTPQLQTLLTRPTLAALAARVTHTFDVAPYTEEETAHYIRHRLRAAGAGDDGPFDSVVIGKIHAASGGIPSRINEFAQKVLVNSSMGNKIHKAKDSPKAAGGDGRRRALLLGGLVVVALLLAGPLRSVLFKSTPLPPPETRQPRSLATPPPPQGQDKEQPVLRSEAATAPSAPPAASTQAGDVPPGGGVKTLPLPPEGETTVSKTEPAEATPSAPAPAAKEKPKQPSESALSASATAPPEQVAKIVAPSPPAPKKTELTQPVKRAAQGLDWLRAQAPTNYTLQLMAVKEEKTARAFIETNHLQDKAAYFPVASHGQTLYALVYGSYPQRSDAVQAAKSLPSAWETPNPWIRRFKSLPVSNR
ncbi:MAG: AAA family ATPase [Gammaproteobacteria bacterium]